MFEKSLAWCHLSQEQEPLALDKHSSEFEKLDILDARLGGCARRSAAVVRVWW